MSDTINSPLHHKFIELMCNKCKKSTSVFSHTLNWWQKNIQFFFHSEYGGKFVPHHYVHICSDKNCSHRQLETQAYPRIESHIEFSPSSGKLVASEYVKTI